VRFAELAIAFASPAHGCHSIQVQALNLSSEPVHHVNVWRLAAGSF
jgi:hypothetical protein